MLYLSVKQAWQKRGVMLRMAALSAAVSPLVLAGHGWAAGKEPVLLPADQKAAAPNNSMAGFGFDDTLVDAADQGNLNAVMILVKSGRPVDSRGRFEATALMRAAFRGHTDIVEYLLKTGANPDIRDVGGATALHMAARRGNKDAVEKLLAGRSSPNQTDNEGWTPLMRASIQGHSKVAEALIQSGGNVNAVNAMGESPLMMASFTGNAELAEVLIKNGARRDQRDANGLTAADIAFQRGFTEVQTALAVQETEPAIPPEAAVKTSAPATENSATSQIGSDGIFDQTETLPAATPLPALEKTEESQPWTPLPVTDVSADAGASTMPEELKTSDDRSGLFETDGNRITNAGGGDIPPLRLDRRSSPKTSSEMPEASHSEAKDQAQTLPSALDAAPTHDHEAHDLTKPPQATLGKDSHAEEKTTTGMHGTTPKAGGLRYLVQLGTHESATESAQFWNQLRAKHEKLLAGLTPMMSQVTLRAEGRQVYRTQAGYFDSHDTAAQLCDALALKSTDCFVVETAMEASAKPIETQTAPEEPKPQEPEPQKASSQAKSQDNGERLLIQAPNIQSSLPEKPAGSDTTKDLSTGKAFGETIATPEKPKAEKDAKEPKAAEPVKKPTAVDDVFDSTSTPEAEAPAETKELPKQLLDEPEEKPLLDEQSKLEEPVSTHPLPAPEATPKRIKLSSEAETPKENRPMELASLPETSSFSTDVAPAEADPHAPLLSQGSTPIEALPEGFTVEEAIRVTEEESAPPAAEPKAIPETMLPSRARKKMTEWLGLGPFDSPKKAQAFWDEAAKADVAMVSGLRFRVMEPLNPRHSKGAIWAEVGPIGTQEAVDKLCDYADDKDMKCQIREDLGVSATASSRRASPQRAAFAGSGGSVPSSVVMLPAASPQEPAAYWVQFGSFDSRDAAEQHWGALTSRAGDMLASYTPYAMPPRYSSSSEPVIRLRVGPFFQQQEALELCSQLRHRNVRCLSLYGT